MKTVHLSAVALVLVGGSFLASASAGGKEKSPLEGSWTGKAPDDKEGTITFTGNKWKLEIKGEGDFAAGTFKVDATKKPKTMDLTITDAGGKAEKYKGKSSLAIYELDGDTLKWCAGQPGKDERPTMLDDKMNLSIVFMRAKK